MKSTYLPLILVLAGMAAGYVFLGGTPKPMTGTTVSREPLHGLTSIAVDQQDRVWVGGSFGVKVLNECLRETGGWSTAESVHALGLDHEGNVYALHATSVEKYSPEGKPLLKWGKGGCGGDSFSYATGICVDGENVFIADAGLKAVFRFNRQGEPMNEIASTAVGATTTGFFIPTPYFDCAVHEGVLYIPNPGHLRVEQYDFEGHLLGTWGKQGAKEDELPGCSNPTNLAILPDGRIVVSQKGQPCLKIFDPKGVYQKTLGTSLFAESTQGIDLAVNSQARVYAVDPDTCRIHFFDLRNGSENPS
jgi:hypothetical protein